MNTPSITNSNDPTMGNPPNNTAMNTSTLPAETNAFNEMLEFEGRTFTSGKQLDDFLQTNLSSMSAAAARFAMNEDVNKSHYKLSSDIRDNKLSIEGLHKMLDSIAQAQQSDGSLSATDINQLESLGESLGIKVDLSSFKAPSTSPSLI